LIWLQQINYFKYRCLKATVLFLKPKIMKHIVFLSLLFLSKFSIAQNYVVPPYEQHFESWINFYGVKNVPDSSWLNSPNSNNTSWRRNNDGASAGWVNSFNGMYTPAAEHGHYSARFHASQAGNNTGCLDLYVNLDNSQYIILPNWPHSMTFDRFMNTATDTLWIQVSTTGPNGVFNTIRTYTQLSPNWQHDTINFWGINSPTSIIRFKAKSNLNINDIGLDEVIIRHHNFQPQEPIGVYLKDTAVCPNTKFRIKITDGYKKNDGTYIPDINTGGWIFSWCMDTTGPAAVSAVNNPLSFYQNYTAADYIDTFVTSEMYIGVGCFEYASFPNSNPIQATIQAARITLRPWYECYCTAGAPSGNDYFDIGCVKIEADSIASPNFGTVLNNTPVANADTFNNDNAYEFYSHFFNQSPKKIYRDSTYKVTITSISQYPQNNTFFAGNVMFIDLNRDSVFDSATEKVGSQNVIPLGNGRYNTVFSFTVPSNAQFGKTGMRIISLNQQPASGIDPCNNNMNYGEVEDYVVEIANYPCNNNLSAGMVIASDTIVCPGYNILFLDTSHASKNLYTGLSSIWQTSYDNFNWQNIPNATGDSLIQNITQATFIRYQLNCNGTKINSDPVFVQLFSDGPCYPVSTATTLTDSADNGSFTIANDVINIYGGGAHLNNKNAVRSYTSNFAPSQYLSLFADSTYNIAFYNILKNSTHADAQVSLFIDFNKNGTYEVNTERVFNGVVNTNLNGTITIPATVPLNQNTGMRLILNNDLTPNTANYNGIGAFSSGEVEDYIIRFVDKSTLAINNHQTQLAQANIYPSPSTGIVHIDLKNYSIDKLQIQILDVLGAEIYRVNYNDVAKNFNASIDLSHLPKGVYVVKLQSEGGSVVKKVVLR
jgi:hypothetical protein